MNPRPQIHSYKLTWSSQVPLLLHGIDIHSSMSKIFIRKNCTIVRLNEKLSGNNCAQRFITESKRSFFFSIVMEVDGKGSPWRHCRLVTSRHATWSCLLLVGNALSTANLFSKCRRNIISQGYKFRSRNLN